ncbi:MAG TPA: sensor domain-containing diguanylate cyclase [candidate division Zixibacteria bacterium]|nr:sensor domain-containing diguanylate cyclase [candidate division Zixibacteria bacterium]
MQIFYDSGKAFLPRIDRIYMQTRVFTLALLVSWISLDLIDDSRFWIAVSSVAALTVHAIIQFVLLRRTRSQAQISYLAAIALDTAAVAIWIEMTGRLESAFYIGFFLIVSFGAYLLTRYVAAAIVVIICALYTAIVWPDLQSSQDWVSLTLRISPTWIFWAVVTHVAEHLRRSEQRMLKLFDTLNLRTSELEKIQAQLESIYDNSRILAGILDVDEVVKAVMQIVNGVLKYPAAALLLKQGESGFIYRGRVIDNEINLRLRTLPDESTDLLYRVARGGAPVRIIDTQSRDDYDPLKADTRSVMLAPMTVRRKTVGVLAAESTVKGAFSERDEKMFWVVARSAAMAIDNAIVHREMEELTVTDDLTGIANYRHFNIKLGEEQRRAARYDQPLSLIMLDIDHFKNFNDAFGHEAGNLVLKGVTEVVHGCIRDTDIFARYGGEEFAIILPQTALLEARQIANRIRESIERTRFNIGDGFPRQTVTVSVGLSSYPENGKQQNELLSLADQALYRAKGRGRNIVQEV